MAVFKRYGDVYYCKYPADKIGKKIQYEAEKVGHGKKLADRLYQKKYEEYRERLMLGIRFEDARQQKTLGDLVDWFLRLPSVRAMKSYLDIRGRAL